MLCWFLYFLLSHFFRSKIDGSGCLRKMKCSFKTCLSREIDAFYKTSSFVGFQRNIELGRNVKFFIIPFLGMNPYWRLLYGLTALNKLKSNSLWYCERCLKYYNIAINANAVGFLVSFGDKYYFPFILENYNKLPHRSINLHLRLF